MPRRLATALLLATTLTAPAADPAPTAADVLGWWAAANRARDAVEYSKAAELYERVVREAPRLWGPTGASHSAAVCDAARLYADMGWTAEAEVRFRRSLAVRGTAEAGADQPVPPGPPRARHEPAYLLAALIHRTGRAAEADRLLTQTFAAVEARFGPTHPETATALISVGNTLATWGRHAEAEARFLRSLTVLMAAGDDAMPAAVAAATGMAEALLELNRPVEAEGFFRHCLAAHDGRLGGDPLDIAAVLAGLAKAALANGRPTDADEAATRCLALREAAAGPRHPAVGAALMLVVAARHAAGRQADTGPLIERAVAIWVTFPDLTPDEQALMLTWAAVRHIEAGRYAAAEPLLVRSLSKCNAERGEAGAQTAATLGQLAAVYRATGRGEQADTLARRAAAIRLNSPAAKP